MRKILDKTDKGELWMEFTSNVTVYHIQPEHGAHIATNKPDIAKKEWRKLNGAQAGEAEKAGGG